MKNNNPIFLAICWTVALILDIASCLIGNEPNWGLVFCPMILLVIRCWIDYYDYKF